MGDCPHFVNFTKEDGLANNVVNAIHSDPDGVMWFGTGELAHYERGGVSRYDGETFVNFTKKDSPDIVFMDIRMPVMDGKEAAQQIWREFGRESIKMVAISASTLTHQRAEYLEMGFDGFISKPFLTERVYKCLVELLGVKYEYEEVKPLESAESLALAKIQIPSELLSRLRHATEFYDITELKMQLSELAKLGAEGQRLAEYLTSLLDNYDMDTILSVLAAIKQLSNLAIEWIYKAGGPSG